MFPGFPRREAESDNPGAAINNHYSSRGGRLSNAESEERARDYSPSGLVRARPVWAVARASERERNSSLFDPKRSSGRSGKGFQSIGDYCVSSSGGAECGDLVWSTMTSDGLHLRVSLGSTAPTIPTINRYESSVAGAAAVNVPLAEGLHSGCNLLR